MDDCDLRSCSPDDVARLCIQGYRSLGAAGAKPRIRPDARHEWTVLAGVVLSTDEKCGQASRQCVVLATGVKAQPTTRLSVHGDVLHDCHAEILVRRALRSWLLSRLLRETAESADRTSLIDGLPPIFVRQAASDTMAPYCFAEGVELHLYCSTLPCGDVSSLNLLRQRARYGETNPFLSSEKQDDSAYSPVEHGVLRGRAFSSASGVFLRTKPGRPQAEPSISMSCTDKIASWSVFGFQGSLLYRWLGRLSFDSYVIGDEALRAAHSLATDMQWRGEDSQRFIDHCRRTLSEKCRHSPISPKLPTIKLAQVSFPDSREKVQERVLLGNPMARVSGPSDELDLVPSAACEFNSAIRRLDILTDVYRGPCSPHLDTWGQEATIDRRRAAARRSASACSRRCAPASESVSFRRYTQQRTSPLTLFHGLASAHLFASSTGTDQSAVPVRSLWRVFKARISAQT